ncbi:LysR family transcriptional regulator [Microbacterium trichothecenolyticum]|uniref:LysR family transcriptional regulator n=1 Tax=Microbacterium trichothecenolyticum TaxID=69370 RepID=UPI001C6EA705|nr:LysR family transcriptional regulator [Microbacterium trichothecenolyticum]MBW9121675.1 LysR family transcriptional regulator [Microbacterium trichothecenolyticum]
MIDRRLRVLSVLAATGTVTATAHALQYTPSAVSAQLRTLSEQLGVTLVVADGRRLQLTAAGRALVSRLDELYALWERIEAEVKRSAGEISDSLRICGFSTAAAALLPRVAAHLRAAHPLASVEILEAGPEECFEMLAVDRVDLAVVIATSGIPPRTDGRFDQRSLMDDPLDLLVPTGHPLAARTSVALRDAAHEDWITDHDGSAYHRLLLTACAAAGFAPHVRHRSIEWESTAALVDAGFGCALVPRMARLPAGYGIVRVPLSGEPQPARTILTATRRGAQTSPLIAEALDELESLARGRTAGGHLPD